jgi:hypothetical protein
MSSTNPLLSELPVARVGQSLSGYVREHLALIERLIEVGIKYEAVLMSLRAAGLSGATYGALDAALFRARRQRKERQEARSPEASMPLTQTQRAAQPQARLAPARQATPPPAIRLTPTKDLKPEDFI